MDGDSEIYCEKCGGCGYIGCDGIKHFLKVHVEGKTDCLNEDSFIQEIIECVDEDNPYYWPSIAEVNAEVLKLVDQAYAAGEAGRDFDLHDEKKDAFVRLVTGQNLKEGASL